MLLLLGYHLCPFPTCKLPLFADPNMSSEMKHWRCTFFKVLPDLDTFTNYKNAFTKCSSNLQAVNCILLLKLKLQIYHYGKLMQNSN